MTGPVILTVTRDFAAPAERVFDAWLNPEDARRFLFATPGGEMQTVEIDARVGGRALIVERRASGDARHRIQFETIERPSRLVFLFAADPAEEGQWTRVSVAIAPAAAGCTLTLTHEMAPEWAAYEQQTRHGWTTILAGLARTLGDMMADIDSFTAQELRFERMLEAPVETVWTYLTDPELRTRWFMGGEIEPEVGGRIYMTFDHDNLSDGDAPMPERFARNRGKKWFETITVYDPPRRLAYSWDNGDAGTVTFTLEPAGEGRTHLLLVHSGLRGPADARNFGGGWHSHLAVLAARLKGERVENFWAVHAASEAKAAAAVGADA